MLTSIDRVRARSRVVLATVLVLFTPACKLIGSAANAPSKVAAGLMGEKPKKDPIPPHVVQAGVMRFADTFVTEITQATREFAERAGTPEARIQALTWLVGQSTAAFTMASGKHSTINTLDLLVLVSLGRIVHEDHWISVWGEADRPMLEAFERLEPQVWDIAKQVLSETQQQEMRDALKVWREAHPGAASTGLVKLPVFADLVAAAPSKKEGSGGGLAEFLSVDPLTGLDPAVHEIEQTRLFAERTLYYAQRIPIVFSSQVELMALRLAAMPAVQSALDDSQRISHAAVSIADTAAALPQAVQVERDAAVRQISEELTRQRQGLLADLERAEAPAREVLQDTRATLEAATQLSASLETTVQSVDTFLANLSEDDPNAAPPEPPAEPGRPFDITEYGAAATQVGDAVRELNALVATLDTSLPHVRAVVDDVAVQSERAVDHAFGRGLLLGGSLIVLAALAVLAVRRISMRWTASRP